MIEPLIESCRSWRARYEVRLGAGLQLRPGSRVPAVVLQERRVCLTACSRLFWSRQAIAAIEAETHVVWVVAPAAVALHAARGTSLVVQSQAHNARVVSTSPTRQGIAQFYDELQPNQMRGPKTKESLGAAHPSGVGICSE